MQIKVAQRFRPFSHEPGVKALLPWTHITVQAFPTNILIGDQELNLGVTGPVQGFTMIQDLERGEIRTFGTPKEGYFEFLIRPEEWILSRCPEEGIKINGKTHQKGDRKALLASVARKPLERLALGSHKAQEFVKIAKRRELAEILPYWLFLGQQLPEAEGEQPLLSQESLLDLFEVGFSDLFYPTFSEKKHLGLASGGSGNPVSLLTKGAKLIRSLFFKREGNQLHFLQDNSFPEGRFIDIEEEGLGKLHFEWTKHKMRRLILESEMEGEIFLNFPKSLKSCRLRLSPQKRGRTLVMESPLFVQKGQKYHLDQFQK